MAGGEARHKGFGYQRQIGRAAPPNNQISFRVNTAGMGRLGINDLLADGDEARQIPAGYHVRLGRAAYEEVAAGIWFMGINNNMAGDEARQATDGYHPELGRAAPLAAMSATASTPRKKSAAMGTAAPSQGGTSMSEDRR